jgi:diacylglycerol kinase family enzyme
MRLRLIVNPVATGVTELLVADVADTLRQVADVEVALTERAGHARELAASEGADVLVAMGGDGTANEVVNGVPPAVATGFLPAGATSVFARQLGYPNEPRRAARMLAGAVASGSTRPVGLGVLNGRRFTFSAGLGIDAEAMRLVEEARALRADATRPSDLRVVLAALRVLRGDRFTLPARMTVRAKGASFRSSYLAVANQHPYTYLGRYGIRAAPRAGFDTALDLVVVGELRRRDLWRLPVYGLVWPRHATRVDARAGYLHDTSDAVVESDVPMAVQLDGEYLGRFERVEIGYEPGAITVHVPPGGRRAVR